MEKTNWTDKQRECIEARDCNVLVSAAAGSGKTAVLVERIFERITDKKNPVDVDQFVIVTFTKLAAAQMKDRLRERIELELSKNPTDEHLMRQEGRLSLAHISTVHSFCGDIIKRYFHRIGLDPAYRQGTESEMAMLRQDVLDAILEDEYGKKQKDFVELVSMSEFNRKDDKLNQMIFRVYDQMIGQPFPVDYLDEMEAYYQVETVKEWEKSSFVQMLLAFAKRNIEEIVNSQRKAKILCNQPHQPYYYEKYIDELLEFVEGFSDDFGYEEYFARLQLRPKFTMRGPKKSELTEEEEENKEVIHKQCRDDLDTLKNLRDKYFKQDASQNLKDLKDTSVKMKALFRLVRRFHAAFVKEKRERGVVDFNDLEQLAIEILLTKDEKTGKYIRTEAANELASEFAEIMIDEYQDSNYVQDTILYAVSKDGIEGEKPNIFMVGDAKQSIYRFRGARPELFANKLMSYDISKTAQNRRIDLQKNFRSREIVLEGTNEVFTRIMHKDIGGVEYDEHAKLHVGREFLETEKRIAKNVDVYAVIGNQNPEAEGIFIAQKIKEMVSFENPFFVEEKGEYRPAKYRDIVILVQTNELGQTYFDALKDCEIPAVMEKKRGFFDTREIRLMTSMLQVVDNPHQDIALASVLLSPMFSLTEEDLALVRVENRSMDLYDAVLAYEKADTVYEKLQHFLDSLAYMRKKASYATVGEIVQDIYDCTGIYDAVCLMANGVQRTANMDSLMTIAREFDGTAYRGLYSFVRYLEKISQQNEEMGEVNLLGEEENVVRIMTIHKSKGLEFPICFVGNMGHGLFRQQSEFMTISPNVAMVSPIVDNKKRTKKQTIYTEFLKYCNHQDELGEAMRKLYVAMTRAKEKLILVGSARNTDSCLVDYTSRLKMKTFFDMVLPAVNARPDMFSLTHVEEEDLISQLEQETVMEAYKENALYNFDTTICYDEQIHKIYEWMDAKEEAKPAPLPVKVSVSDLKIQSMEELDMEDFTILTHEEAEEEKPVPNFAAKEQKEQSANRGALYGTIWHQVMATIDFTKTLNQSEVRAEVNRLVEAGRLNKEDTEVLNYKRLSAFFDSSLGKEMRQAQREGRLHREQPFVMGYPACELFEERTEKDIVLVQGIIDGYYETNDGIVLMDYKTDSLKPGKEKELVERYGRQMQLYRDALEKMTGKKVIKCLLYSFSLSEIIEC